jgi:hypothetical protein
MHAAQKRCGVEQFGSRRGCCIRFMQMGQTRSEKPSNWSSDIAAVAEASEVERRR